MSDTPGQSHVHLPNGAKKAPPPSTRPITPRGPKLYRLIRDLQISIPWIIAGMETWRDRESIRIIKMCVYGSPWTRERRLGR